MLWDQTERVCRHKSQIEADIDRRTNITCARCGYQANIEDFDPQLKIADIPIKALPLATRTMNCLQRAAIKTIGHANEFADDDLLNIRSFGKGSLKELRDCVQAIYDRTLDVDAAFDRVRPGNERYQREQQALEACEAGADLDETASKFNLNNSTLRILTRYRISERKSKKMLVEAMRMPGETRTSPGDQTPSATAPQEEGGAHA